MSSIWEQYQKHYYEHRWGAFYRTPFNLYDEAQAEKAKRIALVNDELEKHRKVFLTPPFILYRDRKNMNPYEKRTYWIFKTSPSGPVWVENCLHVNQSDAQLLCERKAAANPGVGYYVVQPLTRSEVAPSPVKTVSV